MGQFLELDTEARLYQPLFRDRLETALNLCKLFALHHGCCDEESNFAVRSLDGYALQVSLLPAILVRGSELPRRVAVPHVLRFVCFLSTNLTNVGHFSDSN